jgi:hypothetical protein
MSSPPRRDSCRALSDFFPSRSDQYGKRPMPKPLAAGTAASANPFIDPGRLRCLRIVEYTPGYVADHWCSKGHVVLCLSGFLDIELRDGTSVCLKSGQSFYVGDGDPPHRSSAPQGAKLFIVD